MQASPFVTLDDVLLRYAGSATIVTANERLKDALTAAYDAHQTREGARSWPSARISTLSAYLRDCHAALSDASMTDTILLGEDAQRFAWLEHRPLVSDIDYEGLYSQIADAWRLTHDWELATELGQFVDNENHRLFRDWAGQYIDVAQAHHWITEPELPALVAAAIHRRDLSAEPLLLVGFDVVSPSLERLIDAHRSMGADVRFHDREDSPSGATRLVACDDAEQELRAAIHWARDLMAHASQPIAVGIALPGLLERHDHVVCLLDAILRPNALDPSPATSPYNISGGTSLSGVPVVAAALDLVRWLHEPRHYTQVDALLRSPFLSLGVDPSESHNPALPESYSATRLADFAPYSPLHEIVARANRLGLMRLDSAVAEIAQLLRVGGWPNDALLLGEGFQAYHAFHRLLDELGASSALVQPRDFATMVSRVRGAADRKLFAAERPAAPLQVLGYLETVGLEFTHLWIAGLGNLDWPGSARPSPFIPLRLLRAANVVRSDPNGELEFARRLTSRWRDAAPWIVFSYPRMQGDARCRPSPLVGAAEGDEVTDDLSAIATSHPYLAGPSGSRLESGDEPIVPPLRMEWLRHHGSEILRDQSACPFRAFARYRLHVSGTTHPHSFPDAAERGVAMHTALREMFDRLGPRIDFEHLNDDVIGQAIDGAVVRALGPYSRFPALYRSSERIRLARVLREWLRVEGTRSRFRILANEREATLWLSGIEFALRIDRIDRLESDGGLLVVDYKTGPINPNVVMGERPEEPQLPMYASSLTNVAAIGLAQIREGECRFAGWSRDGYSDLRFAAPPAEFGSWQALLQSWRERTTSLAAEFRTGAANVRPRDAQACRECDLHGLCRIRERGEFCGD